MITINTKDRIKLARMVRETIDQSELEARTQARTRKWRCRKRDFIVALLLAYPLSTLIAQLPLI
ncbi:hypothetical protein ACW9UR_01935 [Halovulum sp. GXIMD14794]